MTKRQIKSAAKLIDYPYCESCGSEPTGCNAVAIRLARALSKSEQYKPLTAPVGDTKK